MLVDWLREMRYRIRDLENGGDGSAIQTGKEGELFYLTGVVSYFRTARLSRKP